MHQALSDLGMNACLIPDACVGYYMNQVDIVLVGAEGVVESGGIVNKVGCGTGQMIPDRDGSFGKNGQRSRFWPRVGPIPPR